MNTPFRAGLRVWLLALTFLAVLPLFAFSAHTIYQLGRERQAAIRTELMQRTEAAADAVDEHLGAMRGYLDALAVSDAARRGDLRALYEHARRIVEVNPEAAAIALIGRDGRPLFLSERPWGTAHDLPPLADDAVRRLFAAGKPVVTGVVPSPLDGAPVATLSVPVRRDGRIPHVLLVYLKVEALNELLAGQRLPAAWVGALLDPEGRFIARTLTPERYVGQTVSERLLLAVRQGVGGLVEAETREGVPVQSAIVRMPSWDWVVTVGVPLETLNGPLRRSLLSMTLSGLLFAGIGVAAALWLARTLSRRVVDVVMASRALQRGEAVEVPASAIRELDEMGRMLTFIDDRGRRASAALSEATERQGQLASELLLARCDALTGLPGRALFMEMAEDLRAAVAGQRGRRLALLFIDLDGFKAVNDQHGHDEGDRVLVGMANVLHELIRDADIAGRLGGDEFVVCIAAPAEAVLAVATSIAARIIERVGMLGEGVGCSIGVALWREGRADLARVLRQADEAMYEAKRQGKNRVIVFDALGEAAEVPAS